MKKIVTLGATTLTALTLLGVSQPLAHASQVSKCTSQSVVLKNKVSVDEATKAVNNLFEDGAAATKLGTSVYRKAISDALDKVKTLDDSAPEKAKLLEKIGTAWDLHAVEMGVDITGKIFTSKTGKASDYVVNVFTDSTHSKLKSGYVDAINKLSKNTEEQYTKVTEKKTSSVYE